MWVSRMMFILVLYLASLIDAATQAMCSSENTGDILQSTSIYMSNGLCSDSCKSAGYSLAVVRSDSCWCTNVSPGSTVALSQCSVNCPGFPDEKCGNEAEGLYGYIVISDSYSSGTSKSTTGTSTGATGSSSTTSTTSTTSITGSASTTSTTSTTSTMSITGSASTTSTTSATNSSSPPSATSTTSTTSTRSTSNTTPTASSTTTTNTSASTSQTSQTTQAPATSIIYSIMTVTGSATTHLTTTQVVSLIVSPSSSSVSANTTNQSSNKSFFDSPGKVAGTFTAVGIVVLALVGITFYCLCFHNRHTDSSDSDEESAHSSSHHDEKDIHPIDPPNEFLPGDDFVEVDQRLDPRQMFMNWEHGSRQSLADDMDYSRRVLRVTNE